MRDRSDLVYLDHAATSAVRPPAVAAAVHAFLTDIGATPGRGGHRLAIDAGRIALRCRRALARLLSLPGDPGRLVFTHNATHALNTALAGVVAAGDAIVTTQLDHNAVLRPVHRLCTRSGATSRMVRADADGTLDEAALTRALEGARVLCINAASNVLGSVLDVDRLARLGRAAGALVLVDLAQSAGHIPFDATVTPVDLVALTGHKSLLGPQGTGALWVRAGVDVEPLLTGGTGGASDEPTMPAAYPDHLEAGTSNAPGIAGWLAGVDWLVGYGVDRMRTELAVLKRRLHEGLSSIGGVRVLSPAAPDGVPIVTIAADTVDPATLAARLDREHGVLTRPGLHCAPEAHRVLGTIATGAVRFSPGWASTESDIDRAVEAVAAIAGVGRIHAVDRA
jgi:cysteine desulfurase / selenocysteine lyase